MTHPLSWLTFFSTDVSMVTLPHSLSSSSYRRRFPQVSVLHSISRFLFSKPDILSVAFLHSLRLCHLSPLCQLLRLKRDGPCLQEAGGFSQESEIGGVIRAALCLSEPLGWRSRDEDGSVHVLSNVGRKTEGVYERNEGGGSVQA